MRTLFSLFAALALAVGLTLPVSAEQPAAWPRSNSVYGLDDWRSGPAVKTPAAPAVNAWTAPFASFTAWKALPAGHDAGGQHGPDPEALDAQVRGYRDYWRRRNAELIDRNGDLAPVLPVRIHERLNRDVFGYPVMGSQN